MSMFIIIIIINHERQSNIIVKKNFKVATAGGCENWVIPSMVYSPQRQNTNHINTIHWQLQNQWNKNETMKKYTQMYNKK